MLDQIVAKFTDPHFLAVLFAAIGSAATVLTAAMPWLQPDTLARRIKAVSSERERIRARERERLLATQNKSTLRVRPTGLVKRLVETFNLSSWLSTEKAKTQLAMAGFRGAGAEYAFLPFACWRHLLLFGYGRLRIPDPALESAGRCQDRRRARRQLPRHQGAGALPAQQDRQAEEGVGAGVSQYP